jgi:hypothetical protein
MGLSKDPKHIYPVRIAVMFASLLLCSFDLSLSLSLSFSLFLSKSISRREPCANKKCEKHTHATFVLFDHAVWLKRRKARKREREREREKKREKEKDREEKETDRERQRKRRKREKERKRGDRKREKTRRGICKCNRNLHKPEKY